MTKNEIENGACFKYNDFTFMLQPAPETHITGMICIIHETAGPVPFGTYVWGNKNHMYVTRDVMPGNPSTVAIWKSECLYIGKFQKDVQV